jgi:alanine-glyoxylate transaminase/serine-glyoxylate transaminase/serine-pyruvate transaminase
MARPTIGHLDPEFVRMMDETKELLRYAFETRNELTMVVSGPGSVGMETCFVNLVEPGDKVVVCQNGVFGGRMKENVNRCGGVCILIEEEWGTPVDPARLEDTLEENADAKVVAFVHAETSTGVLSDARALVDVARRHGCLTIVDCVTSLGGVEVDVDGWGMDAVYSGSQKCLSCTPGLAPITFSDRALRAVKNRRGPVQSWFMDVGLVMQYWGGNTQRVYHHTAPINPLYGLHEALLMLQEEGLENAWRRHLGNHLALREGLQGIGLELSVAEAARIPQLNAVSVPAGVDDAAVRKRLLGDYNLEIGAGLGPMSGKIWRVGLMGHSSNAKNVDLCIGALKEVLS